MKKPTYKRILLSLPAMLMLFAMLVFTSCDQMPSNPGNGGGNDTTGTGNDTTGTGGDQGNNDSDNPLVETNGNVVSVEYTWTDGGLQGWVLDDSDASVTGDESYAPSTDHSITVQGNNKSLDKAHVEPSQLKGGVKVDSLRFYYKEGTGNGGAGVRLINDGGDLIVGAASGNPNFGVVGFDGASGVSSSIYRPGPDNTTHSNIWVGVKVVFNWSDGTADITFNDRKYSDCCDERSVTENVKLNKTTSGLARIALSHYGTKYKGFDAGSASPNGAATQFILNSVKFWYTK